MSLVTQAFGIPSTIAVGAGITISNQLLRSYSFTTSEETIGEADIAGSVDGVIMWINDHPIDMNEVTTGHWEGVVRGNFTGEISAQTVYFFAFTTTACSVDVAPSTLTVTHPTFKIYPDPVETVLTILEDDWDGDNTNGVVPEFKAVLDEEKYKLKEYEFDDDTILVYGISLGEEEKGINFEHISVTDVVKVDTHTNGTREHFLLMISEIKRILRFRRKAPPTKPANVSNVYELMLYRPDGRDFSDKNTGHYRFTQSIELKKYWEDID